MNELKFQLSVIFAKTELTPLSDIEEIADEISKQFKEEVTEADLRNEIDTIIKEQIEYDNIVEIPEDFEINDI